MENLAYLQLVAAYEAPLNIQPLPAAFEGKFFDSPLCIRCLSLAVTLPILSIVFPTSAALQFGEKSDAVTELQQKLTDKQVYRGPISGYFGDLTASAVKSFQRSQGIKDDGIVGAATIARLQLTLDAVENSAVAREDAPVEEAAPLAEENAPVEDAAPLAEEEAPLAEEEVPVAEEEAPLEKEEVPVVAEEEAPLEEEEVPVAEEEAPLEKEEVPVVAEEEAPLEEEEVPVVAEEEAPLEEEVPVAEEEAPLVEEAPLAEEELTVAQKKSAVARDLGLGDKGADVKDLQKSLSAAGYYKGAITDSFDELTEQAVISFQQANQLMMDGTVGPATRAALQDLNVQKPPVEDDDNLALKARGQDVIELKKSLKAAGYYKGPVTDYFDELTEQAVISFQQANQLKADGIVGPSTRAALQDLGLANLPFDDGITLAFEDKGLFLTSR